LRLSVGEEAVRREHELHVGARNTLDLLDGHRDLALESALVVDLLLEIGCAEAGLVEDLEADVPAVEHALLGERDASLALLPRADGDSGAAVLDAVGDARAREGLLGLAGLGGV